VIEQNLKNRKSVIIKDSIFSTVKEIKFADFNNDKINDVLVQNISDVRSNWTYYLYLYNPKTNSFKRVKGFEEIKNPKYNSKRQHS
jgi:glutamine synthetase